MKVKTEIEELKKLNPEKLVYILTGNFKKDLEKILINIRDFKKKEKIQLIKTICRFGIFSIKDKLEIVKFLIKE